MEKQLIERMKDMDVAGLELMKELIPVFIERRHFMETIHKLKGEPDRTPDRAISARESAKEKRKRPERTDVDDTSTAAVEETKADDDAAQAGSARTGEEIDAIVDVLREKREPMSTEDLIDAAEAALGADWDAEKRKKVKNQIYSSRYLTKVGRGVFDLANP